MIDVDGYLDRLGVETPERADLATLRRLHDAHLRRIPFENADVLRGFPIVLEPEALVRRLAMSRRGGFCYQLNGAFAALLAALGYDVELLAARFHGAKIERPFGHLALRVTIGGVPWLTDVGGGYSFRQPLQIAEGLEQDDPGGRFRIVRVAEPSADDLADPLDVEWRHGDGVFRPHYRFAPGAQPLAAFVETCEWTRTSPDSSFTREWVCAVTTERGWATLDDRRLRVTGADGADEDRELPEGELDEALDRWFGIGPSG